MLFSSGFSCSSFSLSSSLLPALGAVRARRPAHIDEFMCVCVSMHVCVCVQVYARHFRSCRRFLPALGAVCARSPACRTMYVRTYNIKYIYTYMYTKVCICTHIPAGM